LNHRAEPDPGIRRGDNSQSIEPEIGEHDNSNRGHIERFAIEVFQSPRSEDIELLLDRDTPKGVHWVVDQAMQGDIPGAHKDYEPANSKNIGDLAAGKKRDSDAQQQPKVVKRPNTENAPNIELLDVDSAGVFALSNQQFANEECA
jgi:hypothetical protein